MFKQNDIDLYFIKTKPYKYAQFNNEFIPNLSIIDLMMFNNRNDIHELLDMYELI